MEVLFCLHFSVRACRAESQVHSRGVFFHSERTEKRRDRGGGAAGLRVDEERDINK